MRTLIILRGPSKSGRTRFIREQGLGPWHIDQRQLELAFSDPVITTSGGFAPDRYHRSHSREQILAILRDKLVRGAFIVFEPVDTGAPAGRKSPSVGDRLLQDIAELAQSFRYRVIVIDFAAAIRADDLAALHADDATPYAFTLPLASAERSRQHMLGASGLRRMSGIEWMRPEQIEGERLLDHLEPATIDLSHYDNLVTIGDIHGCYRTLRRLLDADKPRPDTAYVFLGDYVNKGPSSARVLSWLSEAYMPAENTLFLAGNHERALEDWVHGLPISKKAFTTTTLPDFEKRRVRKRDVRAFLSGLTDGARLHWRGLDILATHGGFARMPEHLGVLSAEHLQHGPGSSAFDIDSAWEEGVLRGETPGPDAMIQVHGHRNSSVLPVHAGIGSFNLEAGVDAGGALRALLIREIRGERRITTIEVPNEDIGRRRAPADPGSEAIAGASLGEVI